MIKSLYNTNKHYLLNVYAQKYQYVIFAQSMSFYTECVILHRKIKQKSKHII